MALVSVNAISATSGVDKNGDDTHVVVYRVIYDSLEGPDTARFAAGLPSLWVSAYTGAQAVGSDSNLNAFCVSKEASYESTPGENTDGTSRVFLVTCTFSTKLETNSKRQQSDGSVEKDPTKVWEVSLSYATGTELTTKDKDGNVILNAVEEVKAVSIPSGTDTLIIEGHTLTISLQTRKTSVRKVNKFPMWGLGERELLLWQWTVKFPWFGSTQYVKHRFEFHIDEDKWDTQLLEESTQQLLTDVGVTPKLFAPILNTSGNKITRPVPLDSNGKKLDLLITPEGVFTSKQVIKEVDFLGQGILPSILPGPFV